MASRIGSDGRATRLSWRSRSGPLSSALTALALSFCLVYASAAAAAAPANDDFANAVAPAAPTSAAPGDRDSSFDSDGFAVTNVNDCSCVRDYAITRQADGKLVVVSVHGPHPDDFAVLRYNTDGSLDSSFDGDGKAVTDFGGRDTPTAVMVEADGTIIVVGSTVLDNQIRLAIAHYNSDGSLDTSFDGDGKATTNLTSAQLSFPQGISFLPDGKIAFTGQSSDFTVARVNADGSFDSSFDGDGKAAADLGSESEGASDIALQPDGRLVVVGTTYTIVSGGSYPSAFGVVRFNADGSLDSSFSEDGKTTVEFGEDANGVVSQDIGTAVALQLDGKIVIAGWKHEMVDGLSTASDFAQARLNADGSLDPGFSEDGRVTTDFGGAWHDSDNVQDVLVQPDGRIVAVGTTRTGDGGQDFALARYNANGTLDSSFGFGGKVVDDLGGRYDHISESLFQTDNTLVVVGSTSNPEYTRQDVVVARYLLGPLDADADGVANELDSCPTGDTGWTSNGTTDHDSDGCRDSTEDIDDDNDGKADSSDSCPTGDTGWTSNGTTDHDSDGCRDSTEDIDDDNDTVADSTDNCPALAASTSSGCPDVSRSLTLSYSKVKEAFKGKLSASEAACVDSDLVTVWKRVKGDDEEVGADEVNARGRYVVPKPELPGRYYSTVDERVVPGVAACGSATSAILRLP